MNRLLLLSTYLLLTLCAGCTGDNHFISDSSVRSQVENDFRQKQAAFSQGELFTVFNAPLSVQEKETLTFLYAYMPIGDITDYDGAFYLENIRSSFRARDEMPWGKEIPEEIFRHFVLPIRVNNENLDDSRMVFYEELKDRVKDLSLYDAVLEVNHWCHEKVIYTPSDARTSSPLASVKTAYGRCGEESTFTVAALRAVGIPARQVYTPRWAHTDDNHAWVEAWVDGKWMFMGACEPEPILNLGWFNGPAYRGMLMHTRVFGHYNGPEEIMEVTDAFTEINVIDNYAPTAKVTVKITDNAGKPVSGADVEFKIYNYAEFNTVANKTTGTDGTCFLSAGKGDMLVWATKNGEFGFRKVSFGKDREVTIPLDKKAGHLEALELDVVPPVEGSIPAEVTDEQRDENVRRLQEEDEIRNRYVATFYTDEKAEKLAQELGIDPEKTKQYLTGSRGNWMEIESFLRSTSKEDLSTAMALLSVISAKDLRDTPAAVLKDHLDHSSNRDNPLFERYILNPRVGNEFLTPYKGVFFESLDPALAEQFRNDPVKLVEWVRSNISLRDELNPQRIPVMPTGVWKGRIADTQSRNIFFIAMARTLGIPARIEPVARKVQYHGNDEWRDVDFEAPDQSNPKQGQVAISYKPVKSLPDPKYYSHYTIAKILPSGKLQTLNFRGNSQVDMGGGSGLLNSLTLDEGSYMMVSGTRLANGGVLSHVSFFNVEADKTTPVELIMREKEDEVQVIGSIDAEARFRLAENDQEVSILSTTGRGYFVVAILGARQEPTNHAMRDIAQLNKEFDAWGRSMILLFKDQQGWNNFDPKEFGTLPATITYGVDIDNNITNMLTKAMNLPNGNTLPIFVIADTFGRVVFVSQGYTIGLGEQMMKVINKL